MFFTHVYLCTEIKKAFHCFFGLTPMRLRASLRRLLKSTLRRRVKETLSLLHSKGLPGQTKSDQISETFDFNEVRYLKGNIMDIFLVQFKAVQDVLSYMRAFGDRSHNFEPWSSDVKDTPEMAPSSPNYHTHDMPVMIRYLDHWPTAALL
ncbi:hypothetical protein TNCV_2160071 [Trichonephila clavipes]|nr:hypothetical protein TNCV_2160071 [Trichonephila clavipes]